MPLCIRAGMGGMQVRKRAAGSRVITVPIPLPRAQVPPTTNPQHPQSSPGLWGRLTCRPEDNSREEVQARRNASIDRAHARLEQARLQKLEWKQKNERWVLAACAHCAAHRTLHTHPCYAPSPTHGVERPLTGRLT